MAAILSCKVIQCSSKVPERVHMLAVYDTPGKKGEEHGSPKQTDNDTICVSRHFRGFRPVSITLFYRITVFHIPHDVHLFCLFYIHYYCHGINLEYDNKT